MPALYVVEIKTRWLARKHLGEDIARMRDGHVVHLHVHTPSSDSFAASTFAAFSRAAVDGGIGDDDGVVPPADRSPSGYIVEEPRDILAQ